MTNPEQGARAARRVEDLDLSHTHLHGPDLEGTRITDGWLSNADISGYIVGLRINGVEVGPLVSAELDRLFPERLLLRAEDPEGLAEAWRFTERLWADTVVRARALPARLLSERVDGEWSFLETLRHLIMATDAWCSRMILAVEHPHHPWGVAPPSCQAQRSAFDPTASPGLDEVMEVRRQRMDTVRTVIHELDSEELHRICQPPPTPGHPDTAHSVLKCLHVILDEEWEHNRYASRDLDILIAR
jgi:DinB superfamily